MECLKKYTMYKERVLFYYANKILIYNTGGTHNTNLPYYVSTRLRYINPWAIVPGLLTAGQSPPPLGSYRLG